MEHLEHVPLFVSEFPLGCELDDEQLGSIERYADWLTGEAVPAGGIGPHEGESLFDRHILDSLAFLAPLDRVPRSLIDVGSGVGLPGIPLAVVLKETEVVLLDRSGRRCALLKRAIRVLGLDNVEIAQADVAAVTRSAEVVVSRASLPAPDLLPHLRRMTDLGIVAGSTVSEPEFEGYRTMKIVSRYLETPRWLLIMQAS